jgi:hypothetical protein
MDMQTSLYAKPLSIVLVVLKIAIYALLGIG